MDVDAIARRERQVTGSIWRRFLDGVGGQTLSNTPVFRLPEDMAIKAEQRVLEIGCTAGSRLMLFDNKVRFATTACGVEPSITLARRAGRAFIANRRPLSAIAADPGALPFSDGAFDAAICGDLLRFMEPRPAQDALQEIARVLRPGATLVAWDMAPPSGKFAWWQRVWLRGYRGRWARTTTLISMAERAGFVLVRDAGLRPWMWPPVARASIAASTMPVLAETEIQDSV